MAEALRAALEALNDDATIEHRPFPEQDWCRVLDKREALACLDGAAFCEGAYSINNATHIIPPSARALAWSGRGVATCRASLDANGVSARLELDGAAFAEAVAGADARLERCAGAGAGSLALAARDDGTFRCGGLAYVDFLDAALAASAAAPAAPCPCAVVATLNGRVARIPALLEPLTADLVALLLADGAGGAGPWRRAAEAARKIWDAAPAIATDAATGALAVAPRDPATWAPTDATEAIDCWTACLDAGLDGPRGAADEPPAVDSRPDLAAAGDLCDRAGGLRRALERDDDWAPLVEGDADAVAAAAAALTGGGARLAKPRCYEAAPALAATIARRASALLAAAPPRAECLLLGLFADGGASPAAVAAAAFDGARLRLVGGWAANPLGEGDGGDYVALRLAAVDDLRDDERSLADAVAAADRDRRPRARAAPAAAAAGVAAALDGDQRRFVAAAARAGAVPVACAGPGGAGRTTALAAAVAARRVADDAVLVIARSRRSLRAVAARLAASGLPRGSVATLPGAPDGDADFAAAVAATVSGARLAPVGDAADDAAAEDGDALPETHEARALARRANAEAAEAAARGVLARRGAAFGSRREAVERLATCGAAAALRAFGSRGEAPEGASLAAGFRTLEGWPELLAAAAPVVLACVEINRWFGGSPPNFRTLYLDQIEVDSADFWTDRFLSSSSRSSAEELVSKPSHTRTLKSG